MVEYPSEWKVAKLGDVATLLNGYAFKSETYSKDGQYKVITIANVQDGSFDCVNANRIERVPIDLQKHQILGKGDILVSMTGNVGRVCCVDSTNCLLNQRVGKLEICGADGAFVYTVLRSPSFLNSMIDKGQGGAQPNIGKRDIEGFQIPLPPLPEQKRIAKVLDDVDRLIENLGKRIAKKRLIKKGIAQELLTGKKRLPGFEGAPSSPSGSAVPGWKTVKLGEVAEYSTTSVSTTNINMRWYVGTENMNPNCQGVRENTADVPYAAVREYQIGDLLLSNIRPYLKKCWLANRNAGCSTDVLVVRCVKTLVAPEFMYSVLSDDAFFSYSMENVVGTKMPRGDKTAILRYEFLLPPLPEQRAIAKVLSDMDEEIANLEARQTKLKLVKKGMLQDLLTGKVRLKGGVKNEPTL